MRFSYRITSAFVIAAYVIFAASGLLFNPRPTTANETPVEADVVRVDPCMMWEQIPATVRISTLFCFGSVVVLLTQGVRNRSVPRWLAIACLMTLIPMANHELWRVQQCYTKLGKVGFWVCLLAIVLMCFHQSFQRPDRVRMAGK